MLRWAFIFLIIAIVAGLFGFGAVAGTAIGIAKVFFFIFIALFVIVLIAGGMAAKKIKNGVENILKKD